MTRRKRGQAGRPRQRAHASSPNMGPLQCPNCDSRLEPNAQFCHYCGQEQSKLHIGFWELVKDFFFNNFNFDTRLLVTLRHLLFRPGFLASEFAVGRRASYVPPIRLYLFISFIYFLLLGLDVEEEFQTTNRQKKEVDKEEVNLDSTITSAADTSFIQLKGINKDNGAELDLAIERGELKDHPMIEHLVSQGLRLLNDPDAHKTELKRLFYRYLSLSMFVLMPFFGLLLWLFWGKPRPFYIDTLIFSIHIHSFAFLLLSAKNLMTLITLSSWLDLLAFLLLFAYLLYGLRHLKQLTFWKAFGRALLLTLVYSFFVGITLTVLGLVTIWFV